MSATSTLAQFELDKQKQDMIPSLEEINKLNGDIDKKLAEWKKFQASREYEKYQYFLKEQTSMPSQDGYDSNEKELSKYQEEIEKLKSEISALEKKFPKLDKTGKNLNALVADVRDVIGGGKSSSEVTGQMEYENLQFALLHNTKELQHHIEKKSKWDKLKVAEANSKIIKEQSKKISDELRALRKKKSDLIAKFKQTAPQEAQTEKAETIFKFR